MFFTTAIGLITSCILSLVYNNCNTTNKHNHSQGVYNNKQRKDIYWIADNIIGWILPYMLLKLINLLAIDTNLVMITAKISLDTILSIGIVISAAIYTALHQQQRKYKTLSIYHGFITTLIYIIGLLSIAITTLIVFSLLLEALRFFQHISILDFITGTIWEPIAEGITSSEQKFGALPLITGTFMIAMIAISIATPIGVFSAVYLNFYTSSRYKRFLKLIIEIMAGVPTIVYGFFALLAISPIVTFIAWHCGISIDPENSLSVGIVMAIMITPIITMVCSDVFSNIPKSYLTASLGMGATLHEAIYTVIIPAARPGIIAAIILAFSRAAGETMLVVMALSLTANLTFNPLEPVTTITVQMVSLLTGDQSFDSPAMLSAFALGLLLFIITLILNMIATKIVNNFKRRFSTNA